MGLELDTQKRPEKTLGLHLWMTDVILFEFHLIHTHKKNIRTMAE